MRYPLSCPEDSYVTGSFTQNPLHSQRILMGCSKDPLLLPITSSILQVKSRNLQKFVLRLSLTFI